ncbi:MAG: peptidase T [Lentisphaerae bacterium]|nr:peptidase T [Lentisphaerota bacterium]
MKSVEERFLKYVSFDTQSDENSLSTPSTEKQFRLAEYIVDELRTLGIKAVLTDKCYVYASIPATRGYENVPALGFIAHLDTSDAESGANIKPQIIKSWDGNAIALGKSGLELTPHKHLAGHTIITTDGTTLLGADDKSGIAAIMTAAERVVSSTLPHGKICIGFTPDEEIGRGADFFDIGLFEADFAYTADGGAPELIEKENFNAAAATVMFKGMSAHPGSAKNAMLNAQRVAMEFYSMLPADEIPEKTSDRQGFYHLTHSSGTVSAFEQHYIIRDHDAELFENRKRVMCECAEKLNAKYSSGTVELKIREQYRNMAEVIDKYPFLVEKAKQAISDAGLVPIENPIRGGTDGARLSFMGLPCPNLGYGAYNAHSVMEYADVEGMNKVCDIIINLISSFATDQHPKKKRKHVK